MKNKTKVKFYGIDSWNRPVFKATENNMYFGSTCTLFGYEATEEEVLQKITSGSLEYFGRRFGCEPMGTPHEVEIIKSK